MCHLLSGFEILRMRKWKNGKPKISPKIVRESCQNLIVKKYFPFCPVTKQCETKSA